MNKFTNKLMPLLWSIALFGLFSLASSFHVYAQSQAPGQLRVWTFNIFKSDITRNKLSEVSARLEAVNLSAIWSVSTDIDGLIDLCEAKKVDMVIVPFVHSQRLNERCGFEELASLKQPLLLYTSKNHPVEDFSQINKVAYIRNTSGEMFAHAELLSRGFSAEKVLFEDGYGAIEALISGEVDGVVTIKGLVVSTSSLVRGRLQLMLELETLGGGAVLVSPALSDENKSNIVKVFTGKALGYNSKKMDVTQGDE